MKLKVLPLSFPIFLLFTAPTAGFAYVGNQSFALEDDYEYRSRRQEMDEARLNAERFNHRARLAADTLRQHRKDLAEGQQRLNQIPAEISQAEQRIQNLQSKNNTLQAESAQLQEALKQAQVMLEQAGQGIAAQNAELAQAQQTLNNIQSQCAAKPSEACKGQIQAAKEVVSNIKGALTGLQGQQIQTTGIIRDLGAKIQQNAHQVTENQKHIEQAHLRKQELSRALADLQRQIPNLEQTVRNLSGELRHIEAEAQRQIEQARRTRDDFDYFVRNLQIDIDRFNNAGADEGEDDGRRDGSEMASSLGSSSGLQDGRNDGLNDGTSAGKQRDYNNGQNLGLEDGRRDGIQNGSAEGKKQGTEQALTEVGAKEGTSLGIQKAEKSDAPQVGTNQGIAAGLARAASTGKINGTKIANEEGLKKHESINLNKVEINGPFSGLFSRSVPRLPAHFRGHNYSPSPSYGRDILRKAFLDGYEAMYDYNVIADFERNVGSVYNNAYDSAYHANYDSAVAQTYKDSYNSGYNDGYNAVYSNQFEQSRKSQHAVSYKETLANPNRDSSTYKTSFDKNQSIAYKNKYEEIRGKNFVANEASTFDKNIKQKTEEARQRRTVEVDELFASHPVLSFENADITDGGVRGITKHDGIYQPGETIVHTVTIKNFGKKPMNDATIVSSTGEVQKLPSIPGESEVTIKGAVTSTIDSKTQQSQLHGSAIRIKAPVTSKDVLQAVHYSNPAEQLLVNSSAKKVKVFYPIYMSGINNRFDSLKINQVQTLQLSLMNFSDVIYHDIDVEMASNASTDIFIRKYQQIPEVNSGLELQDSRIMPERIDFGRTIEINGVLKYKGVIVGVLEKPILFKVVK